MPEPWALGSVGTPRYVLTGARALHAPPDGKTGLGDAGARLRGLDGGPEDGVDLAVGHGEEGVVAHGAPEEEVREVHDVRGADGAERAWLGTGLGLDPKS